MTGRRGKVSVQQAAWQEVPGKLLAALPEVEVPG
jgi:hypothetical protein